MNKIWQVTANFEDWESTWFITIGYFTDKLVAENTRDKWDGIFSDVLELLEEPEDWDPILDDYYEEDESSLYWTESRQYEELLEKYEFVKHLNGFQIDEFELNQDIFLKTTSDMKKPLKDLLSSLDRDWKLKQLTE